MQTRLLSLYLVILLGGCSVSAFLPESFYAGEITAIPSTKSPASADAIVKIVQAVAVNHDLVKVPLLNTTSTQPRIVCRYLLHPRMKSHGEIGDLNLSVLISADNSRVIIRLSESGPELSGHSRLLHNIQQELLKQIVSGHIELSEGNNFNPI